MILSTYLFIYHIESVFFKMFYFIKKKNVYFFTSSMEDKIIDLIDETYLIQFVFCFHRRDFSIYFLCV